MAIFFFVAFLIALFTAAFAWQNPGVVTLKFFKWHFDGSLAFVCLAIFALGFLANFLLSMASVFRYRWTIYNQKKKIKELEDEAAEREKKPIYDKPY